MSIDPTVPPGEDTGTEDVTPELGVHAPDVLYSGTRAELRVLLQASAADGSVRPLEGVRLAAVLDAREAGRVRLGEATTGADGVGIVPLALPDLAPGTYWLAVRAETPLGPAELRHEMRVRANARLLVALDAHRVRPGSTAGVQLALRRAIPPAPIPDAPVEITVHDPRGNRVLARAVTTDATGGARVELPVAPGARAGPYVVTAHHRGRSDRCVFWVPGPRPPESPAVRPAPVAAAVARFFPAGGGLVPEVPRELFAHVWRSDGRPARGRLSITLAATGALPDLPLGPPEGLELRENAWASLEVRVPRGYMRPAAPGGGVELEYAARGFQDARRRNPAIVLVRWRWYDGETGCDGETEVNAFPVEQPLTLRLEREVVDPGGLLPFRVVAAGADGPVFLDLLIMGQVVQTRTVHTRDGLGSGEMEVPTYAEGLIELRAYRAAADNRLIEDSRLVHVRPRGALTVQVEATAEIVRPAVVWDRVWVRVHDAAGEPVPAAVDLALAPAIDPGAPGGDGTEPWVGRALELRGHEPLVTGAECPGFSTVLRDFVIDGRGSAADRPSIGRRAYLALLPALSHYGWSVDPAADRRQRRISQLERLFSNLVAYMERHPFAQLDPNTKRWGYVPDLLGRLTREGRMLREDVLDPTGRPYALTDLEVLDPFFRFDFLVRAITGVRIRRVYEALAEYGRRHEKWSWVRRPYWEFPDDVAAQLLKEGLVEEIFLEDGWGRPLQILRREAPVEPEQLPRGLAQVRVVSGGPDGEFTEGVDPEQPLFSVMELPVPGSDLGEPAPPGPATSTAEGGSAEVRRPVAIPARAARRIAWPVPPRWTERVEDPEALLPPEEAQLDPVARPHVATVTATESGEIPPQEVPVPDSGNWMLVAVARAPSGEVGAALLPLAAEPRPRVEVVPPPPVTVGDRFPLEVRAYGAPEQARVLLLSDPAGILSAAPVPVAPGEPATATFAVEALRAGAGEVGVGLTDETHLLRTHASAAVTVRPACDEVTESHGLLLRPGRKVTFPWPEGARVRARRAGGPASLAWEAWLALEREPVMDLDGALARATAGSLLLTALRAPRVSWPEPEARVEADALASCQELLAREHPEGGFAWFPGRPSHPLLTARTLRALCDLAGVIDVDRGVVERTVQALVRIQDREGCWVLPRDAGGWDSLSARFVPTAYVAWILQEAGCRDGVTDRALGWLRKHLRDAGSDAYARALALGALLERDPADAALAAEGERLEALARSEDPPNGASLEEVSWGPGSLTLFGTAGSDARTETTATALRALRRFPTRTRSLTPGCAHLLRMRGADGTWGPTHVTETCLRALAACEFPAPAPEGGVPLVRINGRELEVPPADDGLPSSPDFGIPAPGAGSTAGFEAEVLSGQGRVLQFIVSRDVPWGGRPAPSARGITPRTSLGIVLRPSRIAVPLGESLDLEVQVENAGSTPVWRSVVTLDLPPGVEPDLTALEAWVAEGKLLAVARRANVLRLDVGHLKSKERRAWKIPVRVRARGRVQWPPARAREAYGAQIQAAADPFVLEIT